MGGKQQYTVFQRPSPLRRALQLLSGIMFSLTFATLASKRCPSSIRESACVQASRGSTKHIHRLKYHKEELDALRNGPFGTKWDCPRISALNSTFASLRGGQADAADSNVVQEWEPLTEEEKQKIRKIREHFGEEFDRVAADLRLIFLRGYRHEDDWLGETTSRLNATLEWRRSLGADTLIQNTPPKRREFENHWKSGVIGVDGQGHPVVLDKLGSIEPASFLDTFPQDLFLKHRVYAMEAVRMLLNYVAHVRKKRVYKLIFIIDMTGLGFTHARPSILTRIRDYVRLFERFYPEMVHRLIIINTPFVFSSAWAAVSPFVHPLTLKKILVLGGPRSYEPVFKELGIQLTRPEEIGTGRAKSTLSWERLVDEIRNRNFTEIRELLQLKDYPTDDDSNDFHCGDNAKSTYPPFVPLEDRGFLTSEPLAKCEGDLRPYHDERLAFGGFERCTDTASFPRTVSDRSKASTPSDGEEAEVGDQAYGREDTLLEETAVASIENDRNLGGCDVNAASLGDDESGGGVFTPQPNNCEDYTSTAATRASSRDLKHQRRQRAYISAVDLASTSPRIVSPSPCRRLARKVRSPLAPSDSNLEERLDANLRIAD